jgi:hypothetical protein
VTVTRRELRNARRELLAQQKLYCLRDGCSGQFDLVAGDDNLILLVCPVCDLSSANDTLPANPFVAGARVRLAGHPIVGAGTVTSTMTHHGDELIVHVLFDEHNTPRKILGIQFGHDKPVAVSSRDLEALFP